MWDASELAGKFNTQRLKGKYLLVFPDVDPGGITRQRAALLKNLTCGEPVTCEEKHGKIVILTFGGNIVLNGNADFDLNEEKMLDSTGLA